MTGFEILLISFGVSIDAVAVSAAGAVCPGKFSKYHSAANAALFFGLFQFFMPVLGFFAVGFFTETVKQFDHFIAFFLLLFVGGKMIIDSIKESRGTEKNCCPAGDFFAAKRLFIPAIATSLDALAVGAGIAFSGTSTIIFPALTMGIVTAVCSGTAVLLGKYLQKTLRHTTLLSIAGGLAIIAVGCKILWEHLHN